MQGRSITLDVAWLFLETEKVGEVVQVSTEAFFTELAPKDVRSTLWANIDVDRSA